MSEPKYKVEDSVKHKLGFQVVITAIEYKYEMVWSRKPRHILKTWERINFPDLSFYLGRVWVAGQQPIQNKFIEEELE